MTPLDVVLADIATLEAARDTLPPHNDIAALFSVTLHRLEDEADFLRRVAVERAAQQGCWPENHRRDARA